MKYSIIILFFLIGCAHDSSFRHTPSDTTQTSALYLLQNGTMNGSVVFRLSSDSLSLDTSDKGKPRLTWKRDTTYYVPIIQPLFDSAHHPIIDSATKQQKTTIQYMKTNKENIVTDFNRTYKN